MGKKRNKTFESVLYDLQTDVHRAVEGMSPLECGAEALAQAIDDFIDNIFEVLDKQ